MEFKFKDKYSIDDLLCIMRLLRAPGGCPWDMEQTHQSIRSNLIEETYEVLDAIDNSSTEGLREELGDVLLQVVFHSQMEAEAGNFDFSDVCDEICKKLIVRHPHVFADVNVSNTSQVLENWDNIKKKTKGQKSVTDSMNSVPKGFPALMRAEKLQKKAASVGFDWQNAGGAFEKLDEEAAELRAAIAEGDSSAVFEELGDLLFSVVNVSRFVHADSEHALAAACDKFTARFAFCEKLAAERGIDMKSSPLEVLDKLWDEAKISLIQSD